MLRNFGLLAALVVLLPALLEAVEALPQNSTQILSQDLAVSQNDSAYIYDFISDIYDNNFDNFDFVMSLIERSNNPNYKSDVLIGLYMAMSQAAHLFDPFRAIPLYNQMETMINANANGTALEARRLYDLQQRRYEISLTIIDVGGEILVAGVYLPGCNRENTTVQRLLDQLYASNETLSERTVGKMVHSVQVVFPIVELVPILSNFSHHVRQSVDAMLELYELQNLADDDSTFFITHLKQLQLHTDYLTSVSQNKQLKVSEIIITPMDKLLGGTVCLHQQWPNGTKYYLHECRASYKVCVNVYSKPMAIAVLRVGRLQQTLPLFNFTSRYYSRPMKLVDNMPEEAGGFKLNVFSGSASKATDIQWNVHVERNWLILRDFTDTLVLCGGNVLARDGDSIHAYTRPIESYSAYSDECKWLVDDCTSVV